MITIPSNLAPIGREAALNILKDACDAAAHKDYAHKYTDNEEDLRACIYHRVRNALDTDECWRVFLSSSTLRGSADASLRKPDLLFLRGDPVHTNVKLEILVELKNWPSRDQIIEDLNKLIELRARFSDDLPVLVFIGIGRNLQAMEAAVWAGLSKKDNGIKLWLYDHDPIYRGPWPDPYRQKLKTLEAATNETSA